MREIPRHPNESEGGGVTLFTSLPSVATGDGVEPHIASQVRARKLTVRENGEDAADERRKSRAHGRHGVASVPRPALASADHQQWRAEVQRRGRWNYFERARNGPSSGHGHYLTEATPLEGAMMRCEVLFIPA